MKRPLILSVGLLAFSLSVFAMQDQSSAGAGQAPSEQSGKGHGYGHGAGRGHGMPSVDDHVNELAQRLQLTDDQKSQVKTIIESHHQQMQDLRNDNSSSREDKMQKMRALHEDLSSKVRAVLNDDQKKKFDAMEKNREEHMRGRMHDHGEKPPQPPQQ